MKLKDKIAIVTGAGRGIGRAAALAFAQEGAHLVLVARSVSEIEAVAEEVRSVGREALPVQTDVANKSDVDSMVQQTLERFGKVDILVNNAGGAMFVKQPLDLLPEEWAAAIALNLTSVFLCSQAAAKVMIERGGGRIINISSVAGIRMSPGFVHYGAAKAGVINLTKSLASCWGPHDINVNCIAPGLTATEGVADWLPPRTRKDGSPVPNLQFPPDPEHVADLAVFLASDSSARISGELFPIRALTELA